MTPDAKVPLPKKRMPPKVRFFRARMREKNEKLQELVATHLHAAHDGTLGPDTAPAAAAPPFPRIAGLTEVRLSLDAQWTRLDKIATRWTIYAIHSGPVAGIPPSNLELTITGITLSRLSDDEQSVASHESYYDQPALVKQLRLG